MNIKRTKMDYAIGQIFSVILGFIVVVKYGVIGFAVGFFLMILVDIRTIFSEILIELKDKKKLDN